MTCPQARELFSALVDEVLPPDERVGLERHLAGCAECREELRRFRSVVSLVRAVEPERAPVGFVDRVLARTGPAPARGGLGRWLAVPLAVKLPLGAAAAVLLAVLVGLLYRQSPELEQAARRDAARPPAAVEAPASPPPREGAAREQEEGLAKQRAPEPAAPARSKDEASGRVEPRAERDAAVGDTAGSRESRAREPELAGRLTVADIPSAEQALDTLIARSGGQATSRRPIADGLEVDVLVPRAGAEQFARELAGIGRWQATRTTPAPGDPVRMRIHLVR